MLPLECMSLINIKTTCGALLLINFLTAVQPVSASTCQDVFLDRTELIKTIERNSVGPANFQELVQIISLFTGPTYQSRASLIELAGRGPEMYSIRHDEPIVFATTLAQHMEAEGWTHVMMNGLLAKYRASKTDFFHFKTASSPEVNLETSILWLSEAKALEADLSGKTRLEGSETSRLNLLLGAYSGRNQKERDVILALSGTTYTSSMFSVHEASAQVTYNHSLIQNFQAMGVPVSKVLTGIIGVHEKVVESNGSKSFWEIVGTSPDFVVE